MGLGLIIIGTSIAGSAALASYSIFAGMKAKKDKMAPNSLDSFNVSRTQEGLAVPVVYGRVRLSGNIVWWGDLQTEPIKGKGGGKGGGKKKETTGYRYYVSVWQAISMGKISIVKTYVNDKEKTPETTSTIFNDGTQAVYPTNIPKANQLAGVAHIYYGRWYIGDNVQTIPNIHFVVDRNLPTTVNFANMANGNNPAAVIYDLLTIGGVPAAQIDLASFNVAAQEWNTESIALNLVFAEQVSISDAIEEVLKYVDAIVYVNNDGKYAIKRTSWTLTNPDFTIAQADIKDFSLNRKTWGQVPNDFSASYIDESLNFSQRVVNVQNPAAIRAALARITQSIDLKCFRDVTTASRRAFEIMQRNSYPRAETKFKTSLKYSLVLPGNMIRINYTDLGISAADFIVSSVDNNTADKNAITITALQSTGGMFNTIGIPGGGSGWIDPNNTLIALTKTAVFELPHNYTTEKDPAYLLLAAREKLIETGFIVMFSTASAGDYISKGLFTTFAQYGTLAAAYPTTTYAIDDTQGILFTPYKVDPTFVSSSRADLFGKGRVAICGNEIMGVQTILAEGNNYRLRGIIRGVLNTPIEAHAQNDPIWLVDIDEGNVLRDVTASNFYLKFLPVFAEEVLDASLVTPINVVYSAKAITPSSPGSIVATRTGNNVAFKVYPLTWDKKGGGTQPENVYIPPGPDPYTIEGDLEVNDGTATTYQTSTNFSLTLVGAKTVNVKHRVNGRLSPARQIKIGTQDMIYYG